MRLEYFAASFAVFSLIVVSLVGVIGDVNNTYNIQISTTQFGEAYDAINETYEISQDMQGNVDRQISGTDSANSLYVGSFSASRVVWSAFGAFIAIINAIATTMGIPPIFVIVAITVMTIFVVFAIIYLVRGLLP